jgi:hypothetical protein
MKRTGITRRDFIRTSAGAGATIAARSFILQPSPLMAAPRSVPPSDTVRFGMVGIGMQGTGLLHTSIQLPGVECVAACDLYDGRHLHANEIIQSVTGKTVPTTRRYQDLLDNKDIDCLIVAVPDHWHKQIIVDACKAGKDVYCEKPMTHKVPEGFEIIDAAQSNNRIVQIGRHSRSQRSLRRVGLSAAPRPLTPEPRLGDVARRRAQATVRSHPLRALARLRGLR